MQPESVPLYLKKHEERRLLGGHLWVYSNEVDTARSPLTGFEPGQAVDVYAHNDRWLGNGYVNPASLICARIASRDRAHPLGPSLFVHRLKVALGLRERLFDKPYYRLVFGESDGLPGAVIDRYGDIAVVQLATAGMEARRDEILSALDKVLRPRAVLLRCDNEVRLLEGLPLYVEAIGDVPEDTLVEEHGCEFRVPLREGQKTGWFFDQRDNRARLFTLCRNARVLDMFSYVGAWGVELARNDAGEVVCVDSSAPACGYAERNAAANGVADRVRVVRGEAFDVLKSLRAGGERFDVVVLDPPAFIKRKKDVAKGCEAYRRLNRAALQVLSRDGILVSCSCSFHLGRERLLEIVHGAARHVDRNLQWLADGAQAMDHPALPAMPETRYLKAFYFRVLPRS